MGILQNSKLFYQSGSNRVVKEIPQNAVQTLSKWSVQDKPLRGYDMSSASLEHQPLEKVYSYPDSIRSVRLKTEDDYLLEVTEDTYILTQDGWKTVQDLKVGDIVMENGMDVPPYADKETLKRLYVDKGMTQKQIGDMYGVSARTVRWYVDKFELHRGDQGAKFGEDNPNWKGVNVSKDGGYSRTHGITDRQKTGVCERCGFKGQTQIHHDDRNPVNTNQDNLIELCVMCHKAEHLGAPVRWIRPAHIIEKIYAGYNKTYGFDTSLGNVVVNGFILRFNPEGQSVKEIEQR